MKWNRWWNFTCVGTILLNFDIYFLDFLWEIGFGVLSDNCLDIYALENVKGLYYIKNYSSNFKLTEFIKNWNCSIFYRISSKSLLKGDASSELKQNS